MTDINIKEDDKFLYEKMVAAALEGIRYWRPGDIREAQHIIGFEAYTELLKSMPGSKICKLFYKAVLREDLPLAWIDKLSNKHCIYAYEDY